MSGRGATAAAGAASDLLRTPFLRKPPQQQKKRDNVDGETLDEHDRRHVVRFLILLLLLLLLLMLCIAAFAAALVALGRSDELSTRLVAVENATTPTPPPAALVTLVYANAESGNDTNSGLTPETAVASIERALEVLGTGGEAAGSSAGSSAEALIQLQGAAPFSLGANPVLRFAPLMGRFAGVRIAGTKNNTRTDTVRSVQAIDAAVRDWRQVTGNTGNYGAADTYRTHFVRNENKGRTYVVERSGVDTLDTVVGDFETTVPSDPSPPVPVTSLAAWSVGDAYTAYQVSSVVTWSGALLLDIPYGSVVFEALAFEPTVLVIAPYIAAPNGASHQVTYEGCRFQVTSNGATAPLVRGSVLMRGVYAEAANANGAYFFSKGFSQCIQTESAWLQQVLVAYGGGSSCAALWMRYNSFSALGGPSDAMIITQSGRFYGYSLLIDEPFSTGIGVSLSSVATLERIRVSRASIFVGAEFYSAGIAVREASVASLSNVAVECTACKVTLHVDISAALFVTGSLATSGPPVIARSTGQSRLAFSPASLATQPLFTVPPLQVGIGSSLVMGGIVNPNYSLSTVGAPNAEIISVVGGQLELQGDASRYNMRTNSGTPLVRVTSGGEVVRTELTHIVNGGATASHVVKCGANALYNYQTSQNDFVGGGTMNCRCSR